MFKHEWEVIVLTWWLIVCLTKCSDDYEKMFSVFFSLPPSAFTPRSTSESINQTPPRDEDESMCNRNDLWLDTWLDCDDDDSLIITVKRRWTFTAVVWDCRWRFRCRLNREKLHKNRRAIFVSIPQLSAQVDDLKNFNSNEIKFLLPFNERLLTGAWSKSA